MTASDQNLKSTRQGIAKNLHTFRIVSFFFQITKFKNIQIIYYFTFIYELKLEMKLDYLLCLKQCFMQPNLKCPLSWEEEIAWLNDLGKLRKAESWDSNQRRRTSKVSSPRSDQNSKSTFYHYRRHDHRIEKAKFFYFQSM